MRLLASLGMEAQPGENGELLFGPPTIIPDGQGAAETLAGLVTGEAAAEEGTDMGLAGDDIETIHYPEADLENLDEENADVTEVPVHHDHREELFGDESGTDKDDAADTGSGEEPTIEEISAIETDEEEENEDK